MTRISFEYFPPKTVAGAFRLQDAARRLAPHASDFVSVTYGAGGSTRELTGQTIDALGTIEGQTVAAHLTCVGATREQTLAVAGDFADRGVHDIVALRGDQPGGGDFTPHEGGFTSSVELVEALAADGRFRLHVGAYPDGHPEEAGRAANIAYLKRKMDAGAATAISQFFFDADAFLRYRDAAADAGITAPIVPGIVPVDSWTGIQKFAAGCGAVIPDQTAEGFEKAVADDRLADHAVDVATQLCDRLMSNGVGHLHFYTLNKADLTLRVLDRLGLLHRMVKAA